MSNITKLPDCYAKDENSNNYKLLHLNELAIADVKTDAEAILNALDLQQATGKTLDLYGSMVGQKRGSLNDAQYRALILTRIGINLAQGTYTSVIEGIKHIFNCAAGDIILRDGVGDCEVALEVFALSALVKSGISSVQAVELIESLFPVCITLNVDEVCFEGTLEFADTEDEYDENEGFGDIGQSMGGTFGLLLGEDDESGTILPL